MTFDYPGYELTFIQQRPSDDKSSHLYSLIYKFYSPVTKYRYILSADYHEEDVFAIKFYCKKDKRSDFKYSKIVNKGDQYNILMTCAKAVPLLLVKYPDASFGFGASRSVDKNNNTVEPYVANQRFGIYRKIAILKFGQNTFAHYEYPQISCYLLLNRAHVNVQEKERLVAKMFSGTYECLLDV